MYGMTIQLLSEFMDGAIHRMILEEPFGPYKDGWVRKTLNVKNRPVNQLKLRKKLAKHFQKQQPDSLKGRISDLKIEMAPVDAPFPDLNVEAFELTEKSVAPLAMYLYRDLSRPIDIENWERTNQTPALLLEAFPYCHWWQISEYLFVEQKVTIEMAVDACLALFTCFLIDAELAIEVDESINKILLPGVHLKYDPRYGIAHYVDYKAEFIKAHPNVTLEKLYHHLAESEGHNDRDRIEKRIKGWRNKKNPVQPSLSLFGEFVNLFSGVSARSYWVEIETIGMFLAVQLIQKYRRIPAGDSELLESEAFYRDRVHFWYKRMTEHYSEVLSRRKVELDKLKSDLS